VPLTVPLIVCARPAQARIKPVKQTLEMNMISFTDDPGYDVFETN
jgi:hypothetical protein